MKAYIDLGRYLGDHISAVLTAAGYTCSTTDDLSSYNVVVVNLDDVVCMGHLESLRGMDDGVHRTFIAVSTGTFNYSLRKACGVDL